MGITTVSREDLRQIVIHELYAHPKWPSMSLAKHIMSEYKLAGVTTAEKLRYRIRYLRGNRKEHQPRIKDFIRPDGKRTDRWASLPEGFREIDWTPLEIHARTTLVLSDIHFPNHDKAALIAAMRHGKKVGADCILLNGDILDCNAYSRWPRDPHQMMTMPGFRLFYDFFERLIEDFPRAQVIYKFGNHEERWIHYLWTHGPELCLADDNGGFPGLDFVLKNPEAIGIKVSNKIKDRLQRVTFITQRRPIKIGLLFVLHNHEIARGSLYTPVNAARGAFLRTLTCVLIGDRHQSSSHRETRLNGELISAWSAGCLCDLHPRYSPHNPRWNHGFAVVRLDKDGENFSCENYIVLNGHVYPA